MDYIIIGYRVERFLNGAFVEFGFYQNRIDALEYCMSHPISIDSVRGTHNKGYFIVPVTRYIPTQLSIDFD